MVKKRQQSSLNLVEVLTYLALSEKLDEDKFLYKGK
jgi:hypothetical protein